MRKAVLSRTLIAAVFVDLLPMAGSFAFFQLVEPDVLGDGYQESFYTGLHPEVPFFYHFDKGNDRLLEYIIGILFAAPVMNNKRAGGRGILLVDEQDGLVQAPLIPDSYYQLSIGIFSRDFHNLVSSEV